jgi:hypothetical protein
MVSSERWENDMKAWIKSRWPWVAVWIALLGGCYWTGGRVALGAPPPNCNVACICVMGIGYETFTPPFVFSSTTYYYTTPPLGDTGFFTAAITDVSYNGTCSGTGLGLGTNQMYVETTSVQFPLECNPTFPPPSNTVVAMQYSGAFLFPPTPPPPSYVTYCTN